MRPRVGNLKIETRSTSRDRSPDVTEPDDTEKALPARPASFAHEAVVDANLPSGSEQQSDGEVSHVIGQHVRRYGHANLSSASEVEVKGIGSYPVDGDHLEGRKRA
jgi:hypothetical protein